MSGFFVNRSPSFAAASDLKPKSALFGQIQCLRTQSRQKTGFSTEFCLLTRPNPAPADPKVDKKRAFHRILSTHQAKSSTRGPQSRQKTGFSTEFCLPLYQNPPTATPKVDKKRAFPPNFVYSPGQIQRLRTPK